MTITRVGRFLQKNDRVNACPRDISSKIALAPADNAWRFQVEKVIVIERCISSTGCFERRYLRCSLPHHSSTSETAHHWREQPQSGDGRADRVGQGFIDAICEDFAGGSNRLAAVVMASTSARHSFSPVASSSRKDRTRDIDQSTWSLGSWESQVRGSVRRPLAHRARA